MHVVRHQAITCHGQFAPSYFPPQQIEIDLALRVGGQNALPPIAALRHMVRNVRNHHPSHPWHHPHPSALQRIRNAALRP